MAYPAVYGVTYSYTGFQQAQGNNAFPGTQLDADLAGLHDSIANLSAFTQGVIRSDGALGNGVVTYDSLSSGLQVAGLSPATAWATGVFYAAGKNVVQNATLYRALIAHTSGVFATDLATVKWVLVGALPSLPKAAQADAEAGADDALYMTPLKTRQAFTAFFTGSKASTGVAQTGADDSAYMTALKTNQAFTTFFDALKASQAIAQAGVDDVDYMTALKTRQATSHIFPAPGAAGTLAFWNVTGNPLGSAPAYVGGNPGAAALYSPVPDPATGYTGFFNAFVINQGGTFPASQQYLGGAVPVRQSIVGVSVIPATDTTTWQAVGVAGYAHGLVAGTGRNLVGIFGQATTAVANANLFGGNTLATNSDGSAAGGVSTGFNANYITAFEFNVNLWKLAGGADPAITSGHVYGITIAGSGNIAAQIAGSAGVVLNYMCAATSIPWNHGFLTYDGAAVNALALGTTTTAVSSVGSQSILFNARDAGGVTRLARINADINGTLQLLPALATTLFDGVGAATIIVQNGLGNTSVQFSKLAAASVLTTDASGNVTGAAQLTRALGGTQSATGAFLKTKVTKFTGSGTYTPTAGMLYCVIECVGGGGSGGSVTGTAGNFTTGSGGAGGTYSRLVATAATIGVSQVVTVGAGGTAPATGDNNGNSGGTTSVGALCTAPGGGGGPFAHAASSVSGGGAPGAAGTGDYSVPGGAGGGGLGSTSAINLFCGFGGPSGRAFGGLTAVPAASANGGTGQNYGAGGSGAQDATGTTNRSGGAGGPGIVIITEFLNQ